MAGQLGFLLLALPSLSLYRVTDAYFQFDRRGIVRPKDPYAVIGENLTLTCHVTSGLFGNVSSQLYFKHQFKDTERQIPIKYVKILNTQSIQLKYPVQSREDQGHYTCLLNNTHINAQDVTVEYRPIPVQSIDCVVYNWETLNCTWDLGQEYINMDLVKVQLVWRLLYGMYDCPHQTPTSCTWKTHDGRNSFQPGKIYYMTIIVTTLDRFNKTVEEVESQEFEKDAEYIVKPAPVENLSVENKTSTCVSLSWTHPQKYRTMVYRLHVWQKQKNDSLREKFTTVCGLHPARRYNLTVSCIPLPFQSTEPRGYISQETSTEVETLEDVPTGTPGLTFGSFRYDDCPQTSTCRIMIYWKPVPKKDRNGEVTHYLVRQRNEENRKEQCFEVSGTQHLIELNVTKNSKYSIQIKASTQVGYSTNASSLVIFPLQNRLPYPSDFLVEAHGSTLRISWGPPKQSEDKPQGRNIGYTLYYCTGSKFTFRCLGDIIWERLSTDYRSFELTVLEDDIDNIIVGISFEMELDTQTVSSGIHWGVCVYKYNMKPPRPKNVHFSPQQPDNSLRVVWERFECLVYPVYITHYVISYCAANSQGGCADQLLNQTVPNTEVSHIIKHLLSGVEYSVMLTAVSKAGAGPESLPMMKKVVSSDLNKGHIAGIVLACITVFILLVTVSWFSYRRVLEIKKNFYLKVDPPFMFSEQDNTGSIVKYSKCKSNGADCNTKYNEHNASESSGMALLSNMEKNIDNNNTPPEPKHNFLQTATNMKVIPSVKGNSLHVSLTSEREDDSVDSYLKIVNSNSPDLSGTSASNSSHLPLPHTAPQMPSQETHVGFVMVPNTSPQSNMDMYLEVGSPSDNTSAHSQVNIVRDPGCEEGPYIMMETPSFSPDTVSVSSQIGGGTPQSKPGFSSLSDTELFSRFEGIIPEPISDSASVSEVELASHIQSVISQLQRNTVPVSESELHSQVGSYDVTSNLDETQLCSQISSSDQASNLDSATTGERGLFSQLGSFNLPSNLDYVSHNQIQ